MLSNYFDAASPHRKKRGHSPLNLMIRSLVQFGMHPQSEISIFLPETYPLFPHRPISLRNASRSSQARSSERAKKGTAIMNSIGLNS